MRLDVPHIRQEKQNNCWHASGRMLWGYKYKQSIHPLSETYEADKGLNAEDFIKLAKEIGLDTLPQVVQCFGAGYIENLLINYGAIWCAGQWNGVNHIVVVSGIDNDGTLYVNDPAFDAPVVRTIAWFNVKIDKNVAIPMMYLP